MKNIVPMETAFAKGSSVAVNLLACREEQDKQSKQGHPTQSAARMDMKPLLM